MRNYLCFHRHPRFVLGCRKLALCFHRHPRIAPSLFEVTTASSFTDAEDTLSLAVVCAKVLAASAAPKGTSGQAATTKRRQLGAVQFIIHNSALPLNPVSPTTPLAILAYYAPAVKRQNAAVRVEESGASRTHVGPAPASAPHECRAPTDAGADPALRDRRSASVVTNLKEKPQSF